MEQEALFFEDFRGALRHLVASLGGPKKAGYILRPKLTPKQAENWINDCLNPDRVSKFDFEDIVALLIAGREAGIPCAMNQLCDEAGYDRPQIAPARTKRQILADQWARKTAELQRIADDLAALERDETMSQIRGVS